MQTGYFFLMLDTRYTAKIESVMSSVRRYIKVYARDNEHKLHYKETTNNVYWIKAAMKYII